MSELEVATIVVYDGWIPDTVQVHVHEGGVAAEYLDKKGEVVARVVLDADSVDAVAESHGAKVKRIAAPAAVKKAQAAEAQAEAEAIEAGELPAPAAEATGEVAEEPAPKPRSRAAKK